MEKKGNQEIKKILDLIVRYKSFIIICVVVSLSIGLEYYVRSPKVYKASAIILYTRQKINPAVMSPDVRMQTRLFVANVSQQITSREKLEEIIKKYGLYKNYLKRHPIEDAVDMMRTHFISIRSQKGDTFEVSFQGKDPKKVMLVTNDLASKFVEENLRYREQRASETASYIKDELKMAKEALNKKEAAMRDYKLKYYNEMPDKLDSNIRRLNSLQDQYRKLQEIIQDLEKTRVMVQEQMTQASTSVSGNGEDTEEEILSKLAKLRAKYTENHPEIKRLKRLLREKRQMRTGVSTSDNETETLVGSIRAQLKKIDFQLERLRREEKDLEKEIKKYQKWVNAAPIREAEWAELTRDYEQLKKHYEDLVAKKIQAESVENLEKRQKGSQLKIIEYAHVPDKPYKPDFKKIMVLALAAGLGVGGGIAFLLDFIDTTFRDPEEIETYLGLPVVCSIPFVETQKTRFRKKLKAILVFFLVSGSVACFLGLFAFHWHRGDIIL